MFPNMIIIMIGILWDLLYFAAIHAFTRIKSLHSGTENQTSKRIKTIKSKIQNGVYCYLIENRGVSKISVIIPCYNEEATISAAIDLCTAYTNVEVIVSDGGSSDSTEEICLGYGEKIKFVKGGSSRGECLAVGAEHATGDVFLFLHADTMLPNTFPTLVLSAMSDPLNLVGAFSFEVDDISFPGLESVVKLVDYRCRRFLLPYGDQALFMRKEVFRGLGGFSRIPLMEDYELVQLTKQCHVPGSVLKSMGGEEYLPRGGRSSVSASTASGQPEEEEVAMYVAKGRGICILSAKAKTSARRWKHNGVFLNTFINQIVLLGHYVGVPHANLAQWYYGLSKKKKY